MNPMRRAHISNKKTTKKDTSASHAFADVARDAYKS